MINKKYQYLSALCCLLCCLSACDKQTPVVEPSTTQATVVDADITIDTHIDKPTDVVNAVNAVNADDVGNVGIELEDVEFTTELDVNGIKGMQQAESFANIYTTTCMKYLNDLDGLREKLKPLPSLPPEKSQLFLQGNGGLAYSVPDEHGTFVLALPANKNMCAVYAKQVNAEDSYTRRFNGKAIYDKFHKTFSSAPEPLLSKQITHEKQNLKLGEKTTSSYEWSVAGSQRKMVFMLTTNENLESNVQALFTASIGN